MIYTVLFVHWVADFILQTDKMAINKSTSLKWLSSHIGVYTLTLMPFGPAFALTNGASHFVIDFFTSRLTSALWKRGDRHNFFAAIGLDQFLHTGILIMTLPLIGWSGYDFIL